MCPLHLRFFACPLMPPGEAASSVGDGPATPYLASSAHFVCCCAGLVASLSVCLCCIHHIARYPGQVGVGGPVIVCPIR